MAGTETIIRRAGTKFVAELRPGDSWTVHKTVLVIVNPDRAPRFIDIEKSAPC